MIQFPPDSNSILQRTSRVYDHIAHVTGHIAGPPIYLVHANHVTIALSRRFQEQSIKTLG